jgi:PhoH-like ATPase
VTRKTFVIDTNVLLHDPDAIMAFKKSDVVIPLAVLEELDGWKRESDEKGKNARQVVRFIDSLERDGGDFRKGVKLDNDATLRIYVAKANGEKQKFPLPLDRMNNKILFVAFQLREENENAVLVSKDFVMRVKAESIGLEAQDYENLKYSYDAVYRGFSRIELPKRDIDMFYKDGALKITEKEFFPNEYCYLHCPEKSTALCKYNEESGRLEPLLTLHKDIWGVNPLNEEQRCALDLLLRDDIKLITLVGQAGTGKTLLALAVGLKKVFDEGVYNRILVSRPVIPLGKDIGYLPGTKEEKLSHWMQPIYDNLEFICRASASSETAEETQKWIMESKKIEMEAVAYIRGRSLPKIYMIIDEAQNLTPHEVKSIVSRAGKGAKVILMGDPTQIDNPYLDKDSNGLTFIIGKFQKEKIFGNLFLDKTERSELAALAAKLL